MKQFVLKGKPTRVSREQVRSFLAGSLAVLGYHDWSPRTLPLDVRFRKDLGRNDSDWIVHGRWRAGNNQILLLAGLNHEEMLTTVLHEIIHACRSFPDGTDEKCVSTLVSKLKRDVDMVAHLLLRNTYRRAAYLAHTRISYPATAGDYYDDAQNEPIGVIAKYGRKS